MRFLLNNRDFASFKADIPGSNDSLEMRKLEKGEYCLLVHYGENVNEIATLTKLEWKTLWQMLSTNR